MTISALMSASPSSCAVPIEPAAKELLEDLSKVLTNWGSWYVFGAQAVIAYGVPRLSADVDVTVRLTPEDPERFAADMRQLVLPSASTTPTSFAAPE